MDKCEELINGIVIHFCDEACKSLDDSHWLFLKNGVLSATFCASTSFEAYTSVSYSKVDMPENDIKNMVEKKIGEYMTEAKKIKYTINHNNMMGFLQLYV